MVAPLSPGSYYYVLGWLI
uniref:Uncharacterized protein n=1 Tax=Arundo donax TaxID=35708 RepID=A0A0A9DX79_ARUDO